MEMEQLLSASSITLTAVLTNTSVKQWQYKKYQQYGTFAAYPSAGATTTLTVNHNDAVFVNDDGSY